MAPLSPPLSSSWPGPGSGVEIGCVSPQRLGAPPDAGEVLVRPPPGQAGAALAEAVLREGLAALPCGAPPLRRVLLPPGPALDDLLAAWLCALILTEGEGAPARIPRLHVLCGYTAQLREGILPGQVPPERSLGGVYLAMVELYRDQPATLIARGGHLLAQAILSLRAGRSPLSDDVLRGDETLAREHTYLAAEQQRYRRDREAGQVLLVRIGPLPAHLLCLRQPTSILFRLFAPRDPAVLSMSGAGPGGGGFDLVLVERAGQEGRTHFALFADPTRRLPLRPVLVPLCRDLSRREALAQALAQREGRAGEEAGAAEPWYDGALHHHQRLASPRAGTVLPPDEVRRALRKALRATPLVGAGRAGWGTRVLQALGGGLGLCALGALGAFYVSHRASSQVEARRAEEAAVARGDWQQHRLPSGPKAPPEEREALVRGQTRIRNWALLVAASAYAPRSQGGLGPLRTPWRDACVLRELLVRRFGYKRQDVVVLADSPCLRDVAGPPTRQRILWTVENMPVRRDDTLLFYYAGHGSIEEEPGGRYGYLQPAGWEQSDLSREDRGLRMRVLAELLRDKVAARHQLLLLDSCHSGEAAVVRGDDPAALDRLEAPVRAGWRERPVYAVITAGGVADLAVEERLVDAPLPHSLFVRGLLEALSWSPAPSSTGAGAGAAGAAADAAGGPACRLRADQDPRDGPDGLVTDGELFKYLARRVPELRAGIEVPGLPEEAQRQVPEWNPWAAAPRGRASRIGEFLLIPREAPPARCDGEAEPDPDPCTPAACPSANRDM